MPLMMPKGNIIGVVRLKVHRTIMTHETTSDDTAKPLLLLSLPLSLIQ